MQAVAIITARGGSKRIPGKNSKTFCGKPILAYSIEAALSSGVFAEVMVSTDDTRIAELAKKYGAAVPFYRSAETAGDFATTSDVIREVLTEYDNRGRHFDAACCIYPTAPFITPELLQKAMQMLAETDADSVMPVVRYSFPPQRALLCRDGVLSYQYPQYQLTRSQDLEPIYHDAGQFYCLRTERFLQTGSLVMDNTLPIEISEQAVQDIDTPTDWALAEMKYKLLTKQNEAKDV